MTYQAFDSWLIEQAKAMPHLRGDRSTQQQAQGAATTAGQTAATLGGNAQAISGPLTSFAQNWMSAPPGYGAALPGMESTAGQVGNVTSAAQQYEAQTRAANTGNAAGLSANQDAIAQGASRGTGMNIQDILAGNAKQQLQQQQAGAGILQGLYGTNVNAANTAAGQQAPDINASTTASNSGWLQDLSQFSNILGNVAKA